MKSRCDCLRQTLHARLDHCRKRLIARAFSAWGPGRCLRIDGWNWHPDIDPQPSTR